MVAFRWEGLTKYQEEIEKEKRWQEKLDIEKKDRELRERELELKEKTLDFKILKHGEYLAAEVLKELGMEKKIIREGFDATDLGFGFTIKIDDELRKAIAEKGISAFRSGGAVDPRISKGMGFDGLDEIERKLSSLQIPYDYTKDGKLKIV